MIIDFIILSSLVVGLVALSTPLNNYLSSKKSAFITTREWDRFQGDVCSVKDDVDKLKEKILTAHVPTKSDWRIVNDDLKELRERTDKYEILVEEIEKRLPVQIDGIKELFSFRLESIEESIEEIKVGVQGMMDKSTGG